MFCPHKNSYLQLMCAVNPRVINKAVDQAMQAENLDPHTEIPPAQRLESMQPSLYAPHVDITRARLGFGRIGLRLIIRDLHSTDPLIQLQALHTVLDQLQITENAMHMINLHLAHRLVDLMLEPNPIIREKVCLILTRLASYHQGREQIFTRPRIITNLMWLTMRERKEIRYASAYTLKTLSDHLCCCEAIILHQDLVENLLKMIKNDHTGIVLLHLRTMTNLSDWNPEPPLRANAFQVMLTHFENPDNRIVAAAMDCMARLCSHTVGKKLADIYDITFVLKPFLLSRAILVKISAAGLMQYTTLTTRSKWRAKEICNELTSILVDLCHHTNSPILQLRCIQVLINLCDCPDVRYHMKAHWEKKVKRIAICSLQHWDGTDEIEYYGLDMGIKGKLFYDAENTNLVNLQTYIRKVYEAKDLLIAAINWTPYD